MEIRIDNVAHGSAAYRDMVALRYRVLREPLGLTFTPEQLASEAGNTHLAAYVHDRLAGCLMLEPAGENHVGVMKMRQVAVAPEFQRQGVGRALARAAEQWAREQGYREMQLHARETAVPFYAALGYLAEGEPFDEVGLPHIVMVKILAAPSETV